FYWDGNHLFHFPVGKESFLIPDPNHHRVDEFLKRLERLWRHGAEKLDPKRIKTHFFQGFSQTGGQQKRESGSFQPSPSPPFLPIGPAAQREKGESQKFCHYGIDMMNNASARKTKVS